MFSITQYG